MNNYIRLTFITLALGLGCGANADEPKLLIAAQIIDLLAGNTAIGLWNGAEYRQYFAKDGATIYAQKGSRSALGKWRVDPNTNQYQSWWKTSGWEDWGVGVLEGVYFWVGTDQAPQSFEILLGQQLIWK